ncbi:Unknown protein sequence [Pseudomonas syringae pv. maculicola]|nr:Unknown protein sequence [Pseudomonas syringae pv. maculicola]
MRYRLIVAILREILFNEIAFIQKENSRIKQTKKNALKIVMNILAIEHHI